MEHSGGGNPSDRDALKTAAHRDAAAVREVEAQILELEAEIVQARERAAVSRVVGTPARGCEEAAGDPASSAPQTGPLPRAGHSVNQSWASVVGGGQTTP